MTFQAEDGITLAGTLYAGSSDPAVILAHMATNDQTAWAPFAQQLVAEGFTVLTFNFRGYPPSGGDAVMDQTSRDTRAAVEFLRSRGHQRIVCVGASMGGSACLRTAADEDLAGLVVVSSPLGFGGEETRVGPEELQTMDMPKLFIAAENDRSSAPDINKMYELSPEPKQIKIFSETATHGMDLFTAPTGQEFDDLLMDFLKGLKP